MPAKYTGVKIVRRPRSPKIQSAIVRETIRKKLEPVGLAHVRSREKVVSNWGNRPEFKHTVGVGAKQIFLLIEVSNKDELVAGSDYFTIGHLWRNIDRYGRKPKTIYPKNGAFLRFFWGGPGSYQAKTGASPTRWGGPGTVQNGRWVFAKKVEWPGFPPRRFYVVFERDLKPQFGAAINNGFRDGFRLALREGKIAI